MLLNQKTMKRILLTSALFFGLAYMASAQTTGSSSPNGPTVSSSSTTSQSKTTGNTKGQNAHLNNRKVYKWKDGQRATPTGHQATGTGGNEAPLPKDAQTANSDSTRG